MECEEARIREIINVISDQVKQRRLMMYQYFKDFDRVSCLVMLIINYYYGVTDCMTLR